MDNDSRQKSFDTYIHHHLRDMIINVYPYEAIIPSVIKTADQKRWTFSAKSCHQFFLDWYKDMLEYPEVYELPADKYPSEALQFDRSIRAYLAISKIKDPDLKYLLKHHNLKSKAHSAIYFICDFVLLLGQLGKLQGNYLYIDQKERNEIEAKYGKLLSGNRLLIALKRLGLVYDVKDEKSSCQITDTRICFLLIGICVKHVLVTKNFGFYFTDAIFVH